MLLHRSTRFRSVFFGSAILLILATPARAQLPCDFGTANTILDSGNAEAAITNDGLLFWARGTSLPHFEVPKGSGINVIHRLIPWVGGEVDGTFHYTGASGQRLFYPGPLDDNGFGLADCESYDRIWKVTKSEIDEYRQSGTISDAIATWPWDLGAPIIDGNSNPDDYDPATGDLPELVGHESAFWIGNDGGQADVMHYSLPNVGFETRVFAAAMPSKPSVEVYYFRYTFTYAGTDPMADAYIGLYVDPDLGDFDTDYLGSDSSRSTVFVYKKENVDELYGENPPALAVSLIAGPTAEADGKDNDGDSVIDEAGERLKMTSFIASDDVWDGRPNYFYSHLQGLCGRTGTPIQEGFGCYADTGPATSFWYSGDPVTGTGWLDDREPFDRAFLVSTGPFDWSKGEAQIVEFAVVWARGTDNLDSVEWGRSIGGDLAANPEFFTTGLEEANPDDDLTGSSIRRHVFPNPARYQARIEYTVAEATDVSISIYDVAGRQVKPAINAFRTPGIYREIIDVHGLSHGVYLVRLTTSRWTESETLVVLR